ncbi:MAG TPA: hypothetical protein VJ766_00475, partial [Pseudoxanthomonas sp.]|nr:hypothetical protein [Pseudoxanthomonas sp.]
MQARSSAHEADAPRIAGMNGSQDRTGLRNMQQLIQLRWIAVVGQVVTIFVVHYGIGIALPLGPMCAVLAGLVAFNLGSQLWWKRRAQVSNRAM